jgi:hypothetical protein
MFGDFKVHLTRFCISCDRTQRYIQYDIFTVSTRAVVATSGYSGGSDHMFPVFESQ